MELLVPEGRTPLTVGTDDLHNGWPSPPYQPRQHPPQPAYQLLDALGDGLVPGADDGLRVMLDQVL